jgi:DNA mismatch repair protein MutS
LFATHYHELTALAQTLDHLACYTMRVKEWQGDVVFLHEVVAGTADRSYGIHVAQLAGLPQPVIARAKTVLALLEDGQKDGARLGGKKAGAALAASLPLFDAMLTPAPAPAPAPTPAADDPLRSALKALQPDELTPKAALEALYQLKSLLGA